jgi:hypothetical protein
MMHGVWTALASVCLARINATAQDRPHVRFADDAPVARVTADLVGGTVFDSE